MRSNSHRHKSRQQNQRRRLGLRPGRAGYPLGNPILPGPSLLFHIPSPHNQISIHNTNANTAHLPPPPLLHHRHPLHPHLNPNILPPHLPSHPTLPPPNQLRPTLSNSRPLNHHPNPPPSLLQKHQQALVPRERRLSRVLRPTVLFFPTV